MIIRFLWYGWISSRPIDVPTSVQSNRVIDLMPARTMFLAISAPSPLSPISSTLAARSLQWAGTWSSDFWSNCMTRKIICYFLTIQCTKILLQSLEFKISMSSSKLIFLFFFKRSSNCLKTFKQMWWVMFILILLPIM